MFAQYDGNSANPASTSHQVRKNSRRITMIMVGLVVWLLAVRLASASFDGRLPDRLQDMVTLMTGVIIEALPFVILGILVSVLVQIWLPDGWLLRRLPKNAWLRRFVISLFGIFLPVCECGNVPLSRGLVVKGFTVAESLTFLLAAPIINPITIITTYQAFPSDPGILYGRIIAGLVIANFIGWLYSRHRQPHELLDSKFRKVCQQHDDEHATDKKAQSFRLFNREAAVMMPALFLGGLLAAVIQTLVPREVLYSIGGDPLLSIAAMMLLAFIIGVCSNVDAFFALAFSSSFTTGSLVSFLVFGPIIDIKMLTLMRTMFTRRMLLQLAVLVALLSALAGLVVQYAF